MFCSCLITHRLRCRCRLGLCGFCKVRLRAQPLETPGPSCGSFYYKLRHGKFTGQVKGCEKISLTFVGAHCGDVEKEISNRVAFELLPFGLVAVYLRQARYSMPPPSSGVAKIASGAGWLVVCPITIIHRQDRWTPNGDNHRVFIGVRNRGTGLRCTRFAIFKRYALAPFCKRFDIDAEVPAQRCGCGLR